MRSVPDLRQWRQRHEEMKEMLVCRPIDRRPTVTICVLSSSSSLCIPLQSHLAQWRSDKEGTEGQAPPTGHEEVKKSWSWPSNRSNSSETIFILNSSCLFAWKKVRECVVLSARLVLHTQLVYFWNMLPVMLRNASLRGAGVWVRLSVEMLLSCSMQLFMQFPRDLDSFVLVLDHLVHVEVRLVCVTNETQS